VTIPKSRILTKRDIKDGCGHKTNRSKQLTDTKMSDEQPPPPEEGLHPGHGDSDTTSRAVGDQVTIDVDGTLVRASIAKTNTQKQIHLVSYVWPQDRKVHGHWAPESDLLPVSNDVLAAESRDEEKRRKREESVAAAHQLKITRQPKAAKVRQRQTVKGKLTAAGKQQSDDELRPPSPQMIESPTPAATNTTQVPGFQAHQFHLPDTLPVDERVYYIVGGILMEGVIVAYAPHVGQYLVEYSCDQYIYRSFLPCSAVTRIPMSHRFKKTISGWQTPGTQENTGASNLQPVQTDAETAKPLLL
jgi:hypothetical protein